ncbi:MAG: hypothetical protein NZM38_00895 [Cytophagales bacterium]|nr:hypothetical protein [Cytophagales bacterium]MDW8383305.1 hypothetical protein [Flammeovirgaceae bacterium]
MKMKIRICFILIASTLISCRKSQEETPTPSVYQQTFVNGKIWKQTRGVPLVRLLQGRDFNDINIDSCEKDNLLIFNQVYKVIIAEGPTRCNENQSVSHTDFNNGGRVVDWENKKMNFGRIFGFLGVRIVQPEDIVFDIVDFSSTSFRLKRGSDELVFEALSDTILGYNAPYSSTLRWSSNFPVAGNVTQIFTPLIVAGLQGGKADTLFNAITLSSADGGGLFRYQYLQGNHPNNSFVRDSLNNPITTKDYLQIDSLMFWISQVRLVFPDGSSAPIVNSYHLVEATNDGNNNAGSRFTLRGVYPSGSFNGTDTIKYVGIRFTIGLPNNLPAENVGDLNRRNEMRLPNGEIATLALIGKYRYYDPSVTINPNNFSGFQYDSARFDMRYKVAAHEHTISFPQPRIIRVGQNLTIDIKIDFTDLIIGNNFASVEPTVLTTNKSASYPRAVYNFNNTTPDPFNLASKLSNVLSQKVALHKIN